MPVGTGAAGSHLNLQQGASGGALSRSPLRNSANKHPLRSIPARVSGPRNSEKRRRASETGMALRGRTNVQCGSPATPGARRSRASWAGIPGRLGPSSTRAAWGPGRRRESSLPRVSGVSCGRIASLDGLLAAPAHPPIRSPVARYGGEPSRRGPVGAGPPSGPPS